MAWGDPPIEVTFLDMHLRIPQPKALRNGVVVEVKSASYDFHFKSISTTLPSEIAYER
jgi:hypothetical protein